jgi:biotin synthase
MDIRLSLGSAVMLGLREAKMEAQPTTLYAMIGEACVGACRFCAQARDSRAGSKYLSRVVWPEFELDTVLEALRTRPAPLKRICVQTLRAPHLAETLLTAVARIHAVTELPVSVCMNPVDRRDLTTLKEAGVNRVGVGLDCATRETFEIIKPGFSWTRYHQFIDDIVDVFGTGSVHLIVGLGDSDEAIVRKIQAFHDRRCYVALFAYTPVRGTQLALPQPPVGRYRALQLARDLITRSRATVDDMRFREGRLVAIDAPRALLDQTLETGRPFRTSGCPDCNRPLYNERPGGTMYNYPVALEAEERAQARAELAAYLEMDLHQPASEGEPI